MASNAEDTTTNTETPAAEENVVAPTDVDVVEAAPAEEEKQEAPSNFEVDVTIKYEKKGLGLVIGLSKANPKYPDRPQVVFIRELQRRKDGSLSDAVSKGTMMPQDVILSVNGEEVGSDLQVLTQVIKGLDYGDDITFKLSRRMKDEQRRLKAVADLQKAEDMEVTLRAIFNELAGEQSSVQLTDLNNVSAHDWADKLGIVVPPGTKLTDLPVFANFPKQEVDFSELSSLLFGAEMALVSAKTRHAYYALMFESMDVNGNNAISKAEFKEFATKDDGVFKKLFGTNAAAAMAAHFDELDVDHDGSVTWEEFAAGAEDFYSRALHPNGYEMLESWSAPTREVAKADAAETKLEEKISETQEVEALPATVELTHVPSVIEQSQPSTAEGEAADAAEGDENPKTAEQQEQEAKIEAARQQVKEARAREEQQRQEEHVAKIREEEQKKKAAAAAATNSSASAPASSGDSAAAEAPKQGGCCTIA